jgi:hypothetical protein
MPLSAALLVLQNLSGRHCEVLLTVGAEEFAATRISRPLTLLLLSCTVVCSQFSFNQKLLQTHKIAILLSISWV